MYGIPVESSNLGGDWPVAHGRDSYLATYWFIGGCLRIGREASGPEKKNPWKRKATIKPLS